MHTLIIEDREGRVIQEYALEKMAYSIGRSEESDITLDSESVSRSHAILTREANIWHIKDQESFNGITVDGTKSALKKPLSNGSRIQLGEFTLTFIDDAAPAETYMVTGGQETFKLVRVGDSFAGEEFGLVKDDNTVGRTEDNHIPLSHKSMSRKHASILKDGAQHSVIDLGSVNGTFVNGKKITHPQLLESGDEVRFGSVRFAFAKASERVDLNAYARPVGESLIGMVAGVALVLLLIIGTLLFLLI